MTRIDHFNLRNFDLNLLLAFDALMQAGSVTRAAQSLRVQQPSMSHALSTLRLLLDDPLFTRVGTSMVPTEKASRIAPQVRAVLQQTQLIIQERGEFAPQNEQRTFSIGVNGQIESSLLPELVAAISTAAPGIKLLMRPTTQQSVFESLDDGALDLAIGPFIDKPAHHKTMPLYEETHLCCWNPALLPIKSPIQLTDYVRIPQGMVSAQNHLGGYLEKPLTDARMAPNVMFSSPNFITLLGIVERSPVLATLGARAAMRHAPLYGLCTSPLPFDLPPLTICLFWHAKVDRDPALAWLRERIKACAINLDEMIPAVKAVRLRRARIKAT
ncbi:MAG: LysR family transcriptional regulator [Burkholderiaceae bacterium]|nr:LysR family transcriptional regulator [Burkholderiaceae bacterium]